MHAPLLDTSDRKAYGWQSSNMAKARHCARYAVAVILTLIVLATFRDTIRHYGGSLPTWGAHTSGKPIRVAVLETKGCHDEVSASFFSALGQISEAQVEGYLQEQRYGIDEIYAELPGDAQRRIKTTKQFQPATLKDFNPDVVISITSEYDVVDGKTKAGFDYLFNETEAVMFAVTHHPDELLTPPAKAMKKWIEAGRLRFITLSDHVTDHLIDHVIAKMTTTGIISKESTQRLFANTFVPTFTVPSVDAAGLHTGDDKGKTRFAMQGDLVTARLPNRDYTGTFKEFSRLLGAQPESEREKMELYVLGDGKLPDLPKNVTDYVKFKVGLPYPQFYDIMHSASALLPALASDDYLTKKASSTIPASLIAGAPLVADDKILASYTYLSEDIVYFRKKGESEIDVAARVAALSPEERDAKSQAVRAKNAQLTRDGRDLLRAMIQDSLWSKR